MRSSRLPGAQRRQVGAPVDAGCGSASGRCGRSCSSCIERSICAMPASRPGVHTLVARNALLRAPARRQQVADDAFGARRTSARSRSPSRRPRTARAAPRRAARDRSRPTADVERPPGAEADDGEHLAGGRDLALMHAGSCLCARRPDSVARRQQSGAGKSQQGRARQGHVTPVKSQRPVRRPGHRQDVHSGSRAATRQVPRS